MATLVLSAAGAAIGSSFGGAVLGLSGMVIGRAIGATLGQAIDQRLMGGGSEVIEQGRLDRLRLTSAVEGASVPMIWGRMRVGGQVIWATDFIESVRSKGGGGKIVKKPTVTEYSYSVSLAVALCEGPILGVGRVWADGQEMAADALNLRVHTGSEDQLPDPAIEAVEGAGNAPAYRGIAYVVIEDLALGEFGNRVPQLSFEVIRAADAPDIPAGLTESARAVALMPGTGDFALAEIPVLAQTANPSEPSWLPPQSTAQNLNNPTGQSDLASALDAMLRELPGCESTLLIASWFGSDLRASACVIEPKIEYSDRIAPDQPWSVASRVAADTPEVARVDGRPIYGGTPSDLSVIEAIAALTSRGQAVVFYPFILMEQQAGNGLPDPWSDAPDQPVLPWRGRITTQKAPGQPDSSDATPAATAEVAAFFGTAQASDFSVTPGHVAYSGPSDWRYRRFILHYAALCAAAGGVDTFCIGSEMRSLTQIRGANHSFPAVAALRDLAAEVRAILGPDARITYAADWSEYFGYIDAASNRYFHLDPLWADDNIDLVAIDNYMPLSDWRDGEDHADAHWGSIHDLDYLKSNVAGGEGYDWFYASAHDRAAQIRTPITDGPHDEPWIWRYKDIASWWGNFHHDRIDGLRSAAATDWEPRSKPVWFTEYGCAAIDRGTNQPNVFLDPKSSESQLPYFSHGFRDDLIQMQYIRAVNAFWDDPDNNPVSDMYDGRMIDMTRAHIWAWDARPYPWFPANRELWSDGENWARGHWITGRATAQPLDRVVAEICARAGVGPIDVTGLRGVVRGMAVASTASARAMLQPLMLAHGIEAIERGGTLIFKMRDGRSVAALTGDDLAQRGESALEVTRASAPEIAGRVRLAYIEEGGDFETRAAEAIFPDDSEARAAASDMPLMLTSSEAQRMAQRWLAEARVARDTARFALPPSRDLGAGDVVLLQGAAYRIDRLSQGGARMVEATRVEPALYGPGDMDRDDRGLIGFQAPAPVQPVFLDLPMIEGNQVPHAPWLAVSARAWPGAVAVFAADPAGDFALERMIGQRAALGVRQTPMFAAPPGRWDRGPALRVQMRHGALDTAPPMAVLQGANRMAISTGGDWEVFQFAEAELVARDTYDLRLRLRGQQGSDGIMPQAWPPGALVVALNGAPEQLALTLDQIGVAQSYRIGPAARPLSDPTYVGAERAFQGIGLRPFRPAHLRAATGANGVIEIAWIRRTRIGGDPWSGLDVPLGEDREAYLLRILSGAGVLREVELDGPGYSYSSAAQAADGVAGGPFAIEVAQISNSFGPGSFARLDLSGD